ncbi:MAG: Hsp20/alpha crystallin family protein [Candidatus Thermoplasmatota archaeon]|jgi:HSP20 family molecular chaperone IbpA|nr:Hsp20/alpha crystallin family protein [Candidatus Thermoplasmatota archaeon]MCL5793970.1 Hsp20/alpha crystallin family protein [Candidatus Thermoplasmatota archaeon]
MYGPLRFYTEEFVKNLGDRAREVLTFMYPAVTITEDSGEVTVEADLPGFEKKDVKVRVEGNGLIITASRKIETRGVVLMNQRPEKVNKLVKLPYDVDQDVEISAKYANGVLTVKFPVKGIRTVKVE